VKDRFSFIALEEAKQFLESLDKKSRKKSDVDCMEDKIYQ